MSAWVHLTVRTGAPHMRTHPNVCMGAPHSLHGRTLHEDTPHGLLRCTPGLMD